jgi:hypothetical protein
MIDTHPMPPEEIVHIRKNIAKASTRTLKKIMLFMDSHIRGNDRLQYFKLLKPLIYLSLQPNTGVLRIFAKLFLLSLIQSPQLMKL